MGLLFSQLFVRLYAVQYLLFTLYILLFTVRFLWSVTLQLPIRRLLDWRMFHRRLCNGFLWCFSDTHHEHRLSVWRSLPGPGRRATDIVFESSIRCCPATTFRTESHGRASNCTTGNKDITLFQLVPHERSGRQRHDGQSARLNCRNAASAAPNTAWRNHQDFRSSSD